MRLQQVLQLGEAEGDHGVFVLPGLGRSVRGFLDTEAQRLALALAAVVPAGTEGEAAASMLHGMADERAIVDLPLSTVLKQNTPPSASAPCTLARHARKRSSPAL